MSCPTCGEEADTKYRPFCSKTCADIDLGRWFNGTYTLLSDDDDDTAERPQDSAEDRPVQH